MIVKNAENSLKACLDSVSGIINELVIGFDSTSCAKDKSKQIAQDWADAHHIPLTTMTIESPLVTGFDSARNQTIDKASGDWILWLDSDEYMVHGGNLHKYLRNNAFNGYAIQQHHISAEPVGLMKTDLPVKLFRNHRGINFIGKVHEHPEKEINKGVGYASLIDDVCVMHYGYTDEHTRRQRFQRNIGLMQQDRKANPERRLGMFLWMRDLAQMCRYTMEQNGGYITPDMKRMADDGIKIWEELLDMGETRMLIDGMEFYDTLSQIKGNGIAMSFAVGADYQDPDQATKGAKVIKAYFAKKEHATDLMSALANESVKPFQKAYF
jgi:glycosyltransferase involved in cell wall biosynthesis